MLSFLHFCEEINELLDDSDIPDNLEISEINSQKDVSANYDEDFRDDNNEKNENYLDKNHDKQDISYFIGENNEKEKHHESKQELDFGIEKEIFDEYKFYFVFSAVILLFFLFKFVKYLFALIKQHSLKQEKKKQDLLIERICKNFNSFNTVKTQVKFIFFISDNNYATINNKILKIFDKVSNNIVAENKKLCSNANRELSHKDFIPEIKYSIIRKVEDITKIMNLAKQSKELFNNIKKNEQEKILILKYFDEFKKKLGIEYDNEIRKLYFVNLFPDKINKPVKECDLFFYHALNCFCLNDKFAKDVSEILDVPVGLWKNLEIYDEKIEEKLLNFMINKNFENNNNQNL